MTDANHPEPESPVFEAFLASERLQKLEGYQLREALHRAFQAPADERWGGIAMAPERRPERIFLLWRLVRATAQAKGLAAEEELLEEATDIRPDPWVTPFKPILSPRAGSLLRRAQAARLTILHSEGDGLPLLPTPETAERWCQAASLVAQDLNIARKAAHLASLRDIIMLERVAPPGWEGPNPNGPGLDVTEEDIMAFEELLISEVLDVLLVYGTGATIRFYRDQHGLSHKEARGLLRLSQAEALRRTAGSLEEKRALQEARLENYLSRSKASLDMEGEMKALKELAKVQGLTRSEPENMASEFLDVVRRISRRSEEDERQLVSPPSRPMLPKNSDIEDAEFEQIGDEDALEEYDNENRFQ